MSVETFLQTFTCFYFPYTHGSIWPLLSSHSVNGWPTCFIHKQAGGRESYATCLKSCKYCGDKPQTHLGPLPCWTLFSHPGQKSHDIWMPSGQHYSEHSRFGHIVRWEKSKIQSVLCGQPTLSLGESSSRRSFSDIFSFQGTLII